MPAVHDGAWPRHAISVSAGFFAIAAASTALTGQSPPPFAAPRSIGAFSLQPAVAFVDVNRDGALDAVTPSLFTGTMVHCLDEDGGSLRANVIGPSAAPLPAMPTMPVVLALAGGCIDHDAREDLITVTSCGTVHFHRNLGATRLDQTSFQVDTVLDQLLAAYPINPPLVTYNFPVAQLLDFDGDGDQDLLLAGGPMDRWNATTCPGFVCLYLGNGRGGFQACRFPLAGCVIDVEVADLDLDGHSDHLVVLHETGSVGAFAYELVHLQLVGGALVQSLASQYLGNGRYTDLALADVAGDLNLDYLLARTLPGVGGTLAEVAWMVGDGLGNASNTAWGTFVLPPNPTTLGEFVPAITVRDFDRDGNVDLAVLRGFVQPASPASPAAQYGPAELLVAMGPTLPFAMFTSIALPGHLVFAATDTGQFPLLPLKSAPGFLRVFDLRRDGSPDLLVAALQSPGSSTPTRLVALANQTPAGPTDAAFNRIGAPSGGVATRPARLGFDGGKARLGNPMFAATLQNVQGGCLAGLVWGPVGIPSLFTTFGIDVHLAPAEFACASLTSGSAAGEGFASYALPIPGNPALLGDAGCFQYAYYDHVAGVFGGTQATAVRIGR